MKYRFSKEDVELAVKESLSVADVCRKLGVKPIGGNYKTVKNKIKLWEINTDHFTGPAWNVGDRYRPINPKRNLGDILKENSPFQSYHLKSRLFDEGVKERKCECCGLSEWLGQPIALELDHINGVNDDNRLENLRILCPNCHAQTETYRGKNKNKPG